MNLLQIEEYAKARMAEHGLEGWTFQWNNQTGAAGFTRYSDKTISVSKLLAQHHSEAEVHDTVNHEVAHALAGYGAGHGREWKAIAVRLGARPEEAYVETGPSLRETAAPWVGRCAAGHESEHRYFRKPKLNRSCGVCNPGRYSAAHILTYTKEV